MSSKKKDKIHTNKISSNNKKLGKGLKKGRILTVQKEKQG